MRVRTDTSRRRVVVGTALAGLALAGCGPAHGPTARASISGPEPTHSAASQAALPSTTSACRLAHLTVLSSDGGEGMGSWHLPIFVRNDGRPCRLLPQDVALTTADSDALRPVRLSTDDRGGRTPVLAHHGVLALTATLDERCTYLRDAPPGAAPLTLIIAGRATRLVKAPMVRPAPGCAPAHLGVVMGFRNPVTRAQLPQWTATAYSAARPTPR
jgi:hypothetical protein